METTETVNKRSISDKSLRKLLLKCILSDENVSRKIFKEWEEKIVYDDLDFQSFKLLSAIYPKLFKHNIDSHLALRIKSANRRTWTENQLLLTELKDLFTILEQAKIKFIIADENIRLAEIYNDLSIFSLQNFSIIAQFRCRKELCQKLSQNLWKISNNEIEITKFEKYKTLNINILWVNDDEFAFQLKNTDTILVKENFQPILCMEQQILNLCNNEFTIFGDEASRWQFIVSAVFKAQRIDQDKLIEFAKKRHSAHQLKVMLEKLNDDFNLNVSDDLLNQLRNIPRDGRIFCIKQKIQNLRQTYQMYAMYKNHPESKINFLDFLKKRWKIDSYRLLIKHVIQLGSRLLQLK